MKKRPDIFVEGDLPKSPTNVQVESALTYLRSLLAADPEAIEELFSITIPANKNLVNHPLIPIHRTADDVDIIRVGGLLTGLCLSMGLPRIGSVWSTPTATSPESEQHLTDFAIYPER